MKGFQISHAIILPGYVLHVLQFFGHQYSFSLNWLFVFFFFCFIISRARLDGVTDGEGEEEGSADVAINFMLMKISLSGSLRDCFGR